MCRERIRETNTGIQSETTVHQYDMMQRAMRNRHFLETGQMINAGLTSGTAVEIGPGPGYLGLEWLSKTEKTRVIGVEISQAMISIAQKNRHEYGMEERAEYLMGNGMAMPLDDAMADHVFSTGSLHEWEDPSRVFAEIFRILKPNGKVFISDLKRNLHPFVTLFMKMQVRGKEMKEGLITSKNAAYTRTEMQNILQTSDFTAIRIAENPFGLILHAIK